MTVQNAIVQFEAEVIILISYISILSGENCFVTVSIYMETNKEVHLGGIIKVSTRITQKEVSRNSSDAV